MRSTTIITLTWVYENRVETFRNLAKLFKTHSKEALKVSIHTLRKKDLLEGFDNGLVKIKKHRI